MIRNKRLWIRLNDTSTVGKISALNELIALYMTTLSTICHRI